MDVSWLEQTEADVPPEDHWLSANEAARLDGLRFSKRRADWRLGRWTAKRAVAVYLGAPGDLEGLAAIEIHPAPSGAPEVFFANQAAAVAISLSHRAGTAICAAAPSGTALGCDLELVEPRSDAFIADYFTADEQALVARAVAAEGPRLVTLIWSAKESALKALGEGLRLDTRCVTVSLAEIGAGWLENTWNPLEVHYRMNRIFHGWWHFTGAKLRTLVAAPPPSPPARIR